MERSDLEELEGRLAATYAAKTYADLVPITIGLSDHAHSTSPATTTHENSIVLMGDSTRRGGGWCPSATTPSR